MDFRLAAGVELWKSSWMLAEDCLTWVKLGSELELIGDALTGGVSEGRASGCRNDKVGDDACGQRCCASLGPLGSSC